MEEKTLKALCWITGILNNHNIPYRIGGGVAAYAYGSARPVNDIDISLSGKYFTTIIEETLEHIVKGPKHGIDEKWDCDYITLNYHGQEIDITDIDTLKMSNKEKTEWLQTKDRYCNFPNLKMDIGGVTVSLIHPRDLIAYKRELDGDHQLADIEAIQKYIDKNGL